jgi:hypothetical protein
MTICRVDSESPHTHRIMHKGDSGYCHSAPAALSLERTMQVDTDCTNRAVPRKQFRKLLREQLGVDESIGIHQALHRAFGRDASFKVQCLILPLCYFQKLLTTCNTSPPPYCVMKLPFMHAANASCKA